MPEKYSHRETLFHVTKGIQESIQTRQCPLKLVLEQLFVKLKYQLTLNSFGKDTNLWHDRNII